MDIREKLVEIVCDAMERDGCIGHCNNSPCFEVERVVNALIDNGVTVREYAYLETVVEVKDNTVCRSRVPNEVSQLTKKIVGLKNV